jgi:hypothetical protein
MRQDQLLTVFLAEISESRKATNEAMLKLNDSLVALNETNVLHAERTDNLEGTVKATVEAMQELSSAISAQHKSQETFMRFLMSLILLLVATIIVVAGAQRVFEYWQIIKIP